MLLHWPINKEIYLSICLSIYLSLSIYIYLFIYKVSLRWPKSRKIDSKRLFDGTDRAHQKTGRPVHAQIALDGVQNIHRGVFLKPDGSILQPSGSNTLPLWVIFKLLLGQFGRGPGGLFFGVPGPGLLVGFWGQF